MKTKKIILTGGGTAGHVTPNIALFDLLQQRGYEISYIGGVNGIERELIEACDVPYYGISAGKLRRYLDFQNVKDIFRVVKGLGDACKIIRKVRPNVIFSKGGFVSVPVVIGGWLCKVPVIIHESDLSPGLANKISIPFAKVVCVSFPETLSHIKGAKATLTGAPIRKQLFQGDKQKGLDLCGFKKELTTILVMGGSIGSVKINTALRASLDTLLERFQVIHLCGKGNVDASFTQPNYKQFEYLGAEMPDVLAAADIIISRAGANSICEFLALKKPSLLIPLSKNASRGDQIDNANSFQKQGFCHVLEEENLTNETLTNEIKRLFNDRFKLIDAMNKNATNDAVATIVGVIEKVTK